MSLNNNIAATGTLQLIDTGTTSPITIAAGTASGTAVTITATGGNILLTGNVAGSTTVAIDATGAGTITGAGTVTGTTSVTLANAGDTGLINLSALATQNVRFNTTGNVTLTDSVALTGNGASTGGAVSLTDSANGGMSLNNNI